VKPRRRFYERASVTGEGPFGIALDGRALKTPGRYPVLLGSRALAEAIAAEWQAQGPTLDPTRMSLTALAFGAIDHIGSAAGKARMVKHIVQYAGSDLICYRAAEPEGLVARQREQWDPVLAAVRDILGVEFLTVEGLIHRRQPEESLTAVARHLESKSHFELCALYRAATQAGSALIALAMAEGRITPETAWRAAHLDEDWQIEQWGEDPEAKARRDQMEREFLSAAEFLRLAS
jgi:chaperone required for assembly of F1-ATPase